ncbi:hypothetical protein DAPPUDRAFT_302099 [Daphnia pulex]|uniref:Acylamino-acid-releasing enzyme N-terminal domain-containing protein n=1 Tax=Daphnia pulex TaxID=6669 RepID=E9GC30_DAPPU|nr:hypothetical protein DAPPUDRAFT_302099 [Daphnia pulex]|eukprot:EFX83216.1 hypothetical protein DAPPUDRAFT_302099 [Daphnia pulex]
MAHRKTWQEYTIADISLAASRSDWPWPFDQDDLVDDDVTAPSQSNLGKEESIKFQTHYIAQKSNFNLLSQTPSSDVSTEKLRAFGRKPNVIAIIRETPDSKSSEKKNKQQLEIWKDNSLHSSVNLQLFDEHGEVYTDGTFGCLEFSPDEKYLVYLAEKKEPKKQSFLQSEVAATVEGSKVGVEYDFVEDWGEQFTGKSQPVICIFKVNWDPFQSEDCVRILEASEEWSPGQLIWCSNNQLAGVAWFHQPRRLEIIYCSNRPSQIFKVDISSGKYDWFGLKTNTAASPRHHSESDTIIYLSSLAYGPHRKEQKISSISPDGTVRQVETGTNDSYQGIYCTINRSQSGADSSNICKLSLPEGCTGSVVLDVFQDVILVCGVSLIRPDQLFIGRFNSDKINEYSIEWKCLTVKNELPPTQSLASDVFSVKLAGAMEYVVFKLNKFTVVIV